MYISLFLFVICYLLFATRVMFITRELFIVPSPLDFTVQVLAVYPTEPLQGPSEGTPVIIESG